MNQQSLYSVKKRRISLTALIDVVFILLLFFMLSTSFSQWRTIQISTASTVQTDNDIEIVTLLLMPDKKVINTAQDKTYEAYQAISFEDLSLKEADERVVLLPQEDVPLQLLMDATQHLKDIGIQNVSFGHSFGEELNLAGNVSGVQ